MAWSCRVSTADFEAVHAWCDDVSRDRTLVGLMGERLAYATARLARELALNAHWHERSGVEVEVVVHGGSRVAVVRLPGTGFDSLGYAREARTGGLFSSVRLLEEYGASLAYRYEGGCNVIDIEWTEVRDATG